MQIRLGPGRSGHLPPPGPPPSILSTFGLVNPVALLGDPPMPWHASFTLASGAALSPYTLLVLGSGFRVSGLWALVGFRVAAFRNNAPQPGRGGRINGSYKTKRFGLEGFRVQPRRRLLLTGNDTHANFYIVRTIPDPMSNPFTPRALCRRFAFWGFSIQG